MVMMSESKDPIRKRGDLPAGGHVDVHPEGGQAGLGVILRVGVNRDMALVQMGQLRLPHRDHGAFGDENGHRSALGVVILPGNVQHLGADHVRQGGQNVGEALGVVLLVNVGDVVPLFPGGFGVAYVVNVEAEGLGQVVEAVELELFSHGGVSPLFL